MEQTKRQDFPPAPPGLWVVATPIGNLGDMTERAKLALAGADLVLCEDTRKTRALLSAFNLPANSERLERLDEYTSESVMKTWVRDMVQGRTIALVTDAGTPGISDPGAGLVALAKSGGVRVTPIPGVSAVTALLSVSGFQKTHFLFRGFFPRKDSDRRREVELASHDKAASVSVWYESPHRIVESLNILAELVPEAEVVVAKELTKMYEKIFYGTAAAVSFQVQEEIAQEGALGEWCFAGEFSQARSNSTNESASLLETEPALAKALACLFKAGISPSESATLVSQEFGVPKRKCYELALFLSGREKKGGKSV